MPHISISWFSLLAMAAEGNRRTADVRCKGFTNLFILSKNEFEAAMKDYPDAHKLLKKRAKYVFRQSCFVTSYNNEIFKSLVLTLV